LRLNGAPIKRCEQAKHLGSFIGRDCGSRNIKEAIAHLYSSTNVIMARFGH
jgi:hypothetical protein